MGVSLPLVAMGRWSAFESGPESESGFERQERLASICYALLRRYGVVFRAVLQRETLLPPWRELLCYLRRMEDRGEVNGGRFVDGFSGELIEQQIQIHKHAPLVGGQGTDIPAPALRRPGKYLDGRLVFS